MELMEAWDPDSKDAEVDAEGEAQPYLQCILQNNETSKMSLKTSTSYWSLFLLGSIYMIGELGHFLLGTVSRSMSQDIHFGDKGCLKISTYKELSSELCSDVEHEQECFNVSTELGDGVVVWPCEWDYTGLGLEYHVLAGPAFVAVFTLAGLGWGYFADKFNRVHFLTFATLIFSCSIIATSLATSYWHVLLFRMALALGESGCSPLASGIIADMFPHKRRGLAMSFYNWGIYIGYGLSYTVGNYVTDANIFDKSWRMSYVVSGIPGIALALIFFCTATEPPRSDNQVDGTKLNEILNCSGDHKASPLEGDKGKSAPVTERDDAGGMGGEAQLGIHISTSSPQNDNPKRSQDVKGSSRQSGKWKGLVHGIRVGWDIMKNPAMMFLLIGACVRHSAGFCWGYNSALYFKTYYPGATGTLIGGYMSDRLVSKMGVPARALVLAASQLIAAPFAFALFFLDPPWALISLLLGYIAAEMWFGVMFAILVELVPSDIKSKAIAVVLFCINNVGGNTPVIVDPIANVTNYRTAIIVLYPGALITSSLLFFICWGILRRQRG